MKVLALWPCHRLTLWISAPDHEPLRRAPQRTAYQDDDQQSSGQKAAGLRPISNIERECGLLGCRAASRSGWRRVVRPRWQRSPRVGGGNSDEPLSNKPFAAEFERLRTTQSKHKALLRKVFVIAVGVAILIVTSQDVVHLIKLWNES